MHLKLQFSFGEFC